MKYLLDTCLISELVKKNPNPKVIEWIDAQDENDLYLSVITFGEIQKGISKLDDSHRKQKIQIWLEELKERFRGRILDLDFDIMINWGETLGELSKNGLKVPVVDSLLAATADECKLSIVTRNVQDFRFYHVGVLNPWK